MHELSLAQNLVEIAGDAAREANARQVTAVNLRLGALSGVVKDALLFGYDVVTQGTLLEGSSLNIEALPVIVHCPDCQVETTLPDIYHFRCGQCGKPTAHIIQGKELEIISVEYSE